MEHSYIDEHDLVSRYVAGHLSGDEVGDFEAHFVDCAACLQRLEAEQELRAGLASLEGTWVAAPGRPRPAKPFLIPLPALAAAAVAVVAVGTTVGYVQVQRQLDAERTRVAALERNYADARAKADALARAQATPPAPGRIAVFELDSTRAAGPPTSAPSIVVPASTSLVVFSLAVGDAADYSSFVATLEATSGTPLLRQDDLRSASPTSVAVAVDAHNLVAGDYTIVLEGVIRNRPPVIVARYPLRVIRR